jgi:RimJ/RimL family protein N-acetyltransferase
MPFAVPWTDAETEMLHTNTLKFYWNCRAQTEPNHWTLPFVVIEQGVVIGSSGLNADNFPVLRQFETGSWLGREYEGRGLGRELREAALHLGFVGLGATLAKTGLFADNAPSLGVTQSLGYSPNGVGQSLRRREAATHLDFELAIDDWEKRLRRNDILIHGVEPCLQFLGLS